jgi:hypothetical protein
VRQDGRLLSIAGCCSSSGEAGLEGGVGSLSLKEKKCTLKLLMYVPVL